MEAYTDFGMLAAAGDALVIILTPERLGFLCIGVLAGLVIGILPGIGGLTGFALLMPFTFTMEPYSAFAMLLGMASVTATSDTIPAILFGIPGTAASQAVVIEGRPMTERGEAGRALSAAYSASLLGGLFGALILAVSIPILRPFVLAIGSPELLALAVLGISMVASLSGSSPAKGIIVAGFGVALAMVGTDPRTGTFRWTLDTLYLWDGLPLLPVILGMFALPEVCDLAIKRTVLARKIELKPGEGMLQGIRDTLDNIWLVIRCSSLGAVIGAIPGVASSVCDWIAYGHALRSSKEAEVTFGKGDVRGVIAPESANYATQGGQMVPTLAFGIPGGPSMALFMGAIMIHGIVPGPDMLSRNLDVTYAMVWSVAIANILGAGICFLFAGYLARLTLLRYTLLLPAIICIVYIGAYQATRDWGDIYVLLIFGVIGWTMKRLGWPRPPLVLGFVLGVMIERYLTISVTRFGIEWLARPGVVVLFVISAVMLIKPLWGNWKKFRAGGGNRLAFVFTPELLFYLPITAIAAYMLFEASEWTYRARLGPTIVLTTVLIAIAISFVGQIVRPRIPDADDGAHFDVKSDMGGLANMVVLQRAAIFAGWMIGFCISMALIGMMPTAALFVVLYMRVEGRERWLTSLLYALAIAVFIYVIFVKTLNVPWPRSMLGNWFPALREFIPTI